MSMDEEKTQRRYAGAKHFLNLPLDGNNKEEEESSLTQLSLEKSNPKVTGEISHFLAAQAAELSDDEFVEKSGRIRMALAVRINADDEASRKTLASLPLSVNPLANPALFDAVMGGLQEKKKDCNLNDDDEATTRPQIDCTLTHHAEKLLKEEVIQRLTFIIQRGAERALTRRDVQRKANSTALCRIDEARNLVKDPTRASDRARQLICLRNYLIQSSHIRATVTKAQQAINRSHFLSKFAQRQKRSREGQDEELDEESVMMKAAGENASEDGDADIGLDDDDAELALDLDVEKGDEEHREHLCTERLLGPKAISPFEVVMEYSNCITRSQLRVVQQHEEFCSANPDQEQEDEEKSKEWLDQFPLKIEQKDLEEDLL